LKLEVGGTGRERKKKRLGSEEPTRALTLPGGETSLLWRAREMLGLKSIQIKDGSKGLVQESRDVMVSERVGGVVGHNVEGGRQKCSSQGIEIRILKTG